MLKNMTKLKKRLFILLLVLVTLFIACFLFLFLSWLNHKTYIYESKIIDGEISHTEETLKRSEVLPYFEEREHYTNQNALVNIDTKKLPYASFNFAREFRSKLLLYRLLITRGCFYWDLPLQNADHFYIDSLGVASYTEYYFDVPKQDHDEVCKHYRDDLTHMSPSIQNFYKDIYQKGFCSGSSRFQIDDIKPFFLLSYNILLDNDNNAYIATCYISGNKYFNGDYSEFYSNIVDSKTCEIITVGDYQLFIGENEAYLAENIRYKEETWKGSLKEQTKSIVVKSYKIETFNNVKYINMDAIKDLYGYDISYTLTMGLVNGEIIRLGLLDSEYNRPSWLLYRFSPIDWANNKSYDRSYIRRLDNIVIKR